MNAIIYPLYDPKKENLFSTTSKSNYKLRETILFSVMMSGMGYTRYTLEIILSVSYRDDGIYRSTCFVTPFESSFVIIPTSINASIYFRVNSIGTATIKKIVFTPSIAINLQNHFAKMTIFAWHNYGIVCGFKKFKITKTTSVVIWYSNEAHNELSSEPATTIENIRRIEVSLGSKIGPIPLSI